MSRGRGGRMPLAPTLSMLVTLVLAGAGPARGASIVLPRPGQVGVGLQGGWGALAKSGDFGGTFGNGPTLAIRLRYRMRYERAIGLSFENERFEIRAPEPYFPAGQIQLLGRVRANLVLSGLELYQMFGTRTRTTKMVMVGAGLAQASARTADKDTVYPGNGSYVSAGTGAERFLVRSWAIDLSARYMAVFLPDDRNHEVQVALGVIWYASY